MTTTGKNPNVSAPIGSVEIVVTSLLQGGAVIEVGWSGESPWVPKGSMVLSTNDDSVVGLTSGQVTEGLIRQLRPVLQSMLSGVWNPF